MFERYCNGYDDLPCGGPAPLAFSCAIPTIGSLQQASTQAHCILRPRFQTTHLAKGSAPTAGA